MCTFGFHALAFADVSVRSHQPQRAALGVVIGDHAMAFDPQPSVGGAHAVLNHRALLPALQQFACCRLCTGAVVGVDPLNQG
ncbi:hypothetical protein D9M68_873140 [compost metagenome]